MSYVRGWTAYFSDGSIYSSTTHTISQLPSTGMQVWMLYFLDGTRRIMHGNDRYFFFNNGSEDGVFASTDDPVSEIAVRYPNSIIIESSLMPDQDYKAIVQSSLQRKEP